jgi:hypothetical protein
VTTDHEEGGAVTKQRRYELLFTCVQRQPVHFCAL